MGLIGICLPVMCFFLGPAAQGNLIPGLFLLAGFGCAGICLLTSLVVLLLVRSELRNVGAARWGLALGIVGLGINVAIGSMFS